MFNKRAQVSEAMVWVVATIIIILILAIFVFVSSNLSDVKSLKKEVTSVFGESNMSFDLIGKKNDFAYELNNKNKAQIGSWIKDELK